MARAALRHVHPLGSGEPEGHRDRLVARRRAARHGRHGRDPARRLRQPVQGVQSHQVRREGMGGAGEGRGHEVPGLHDQASRRLRGVRLEAYRLQDHQLAVPSRHRRRAVARLPRGGARVRHLLLAARLAPPRLPHREPRAVHRVPARAAPRAVHELREDRHDLLRRPGRHVERLGRAAAPAHDPRAAAGHRHQRSRRAARRQRHAGADHRRVR